MRQRFIEAAQHPGVMHQRLAMLAAQEVSISSGPFAGTAPLATNATIALTIAKAEAQYVEILTHISAAEATIAKLTEAGAAPGRNEPPPLTAQDADQIKSIFIVIKNVKAAVPLQTPAAEVKEAPTKLNSFLDRLKAYADTFVMKAAESGGATAGTAIVGVTAAATISNEIPFVSLCHLLINQLTELSSLITDWHSTIAALVS